MFVFHGGDNGQNRLVTQSYICTVSFPSRRIWQRVDWPITNKVDKATIGQATCLGIILLSPHCPNLCPKRETIAKEAIIPKSQVPKAKPKLKVVNLPLRKTKSPPFPPSKTRPFKGQPRSVTSSTRTKKRAFGSPWSPCWANATRNSIILTWKRPLWPRSMSTFRIRCCRPPNPSPCKPTRWTWTWSPKVIPCGSAPSPWTAMATKALNWVSVPLLTAWTTPNPSLPMCQWRMHYVPKTIRMRTRSRICPPRRPRRRWKKGSSHRFRLRLDLHLVPPRPWHPPERYIFLQYCKAWKIDSRVKKCVCEMKWSFTINRLCRWHPSGKSMKTSPVAANSTWTLQRKKGRGNHRENHVQARVSDEHSFFSSYFF